MCGFVGILAPKGLRGALGDRLTGMCQAIASRGPDGDGTWIDSDLGVALGHRRLAILDLTAAGRQPMRSASGRYVVAFNGEIYNFASLRAELQQSGLAPAWMGHSDTEVLLAAVEAWGFEAALQRLTGMFAIAMWDRERRELLLARDRFGEKPLYYGWHGDVLLCASELKALAAYPGWNGEVDRSAIQLYLRYAYIPAPYSVYRGIRKLEPGNWLALPLQTPAGTLPHPRAYWSVVDLAGAGDSAYPADDAAAEEELAGLLRRAVGRQMVADVPLGAFLSGGVDSSLVVALMQAQSARPVRTFTIGFLDGGYNEADHAKAVAKHLGTEHTEVYVTPDEARQIIPRLPELYDEPFADSSQIPTHLVAGVARRHVTVALSGDGGDELFGGYNRYAWGRNIWRSAAPFPLWLRRGGARAVQRVRPETWDALYSAVRPLLPRRLRMTMPGHKLHKLAGIVDSTSPEDLYRRLVSQWPSPGELMSGGTEPATWADVETHRGMRSNLTERMMLRDQLSYLPDDILVKVDRAAMGVSLETRVPLLDHEVAEFAWRLPLSMKIREGQGKWLLRRVLDRYVPRALIERPKQGFGVPLDTWLRGPLRGWAEALLDRRRLHEDGFFDVNAVRSRWEEHLAGRRNWQYGLWNILMFQAWLDRWQR